MIRNLRWPLLVAASTLVAVVMFVLDLSGPIRIAAVGWFMLACPGLAWSPLLRAPSTADTLILALALSLAINAMLAAALLAGGIFSASAGVVGLAGVCTAGCLIQLVIATRGDHPHGPDLIRVYKRI